MDFWSMAKSAFQNAYLSGIKKKLIILGVGILIFIILITILVGVILKDDEEKNKNGTYNALASYSFWWPIGGQEITTDEYGKEYAIGDPTAVNISSDYRDRNMERPDHNGIDIQSTDINGVYQGEGYHYIVASKSGTVIASHLSGTAGEYVVIDHGNGFVTKYMHMYENSRKVSEGDVVKQGQVLGLMGNTGDSSGPHLHFQIELNGEVVDPLQYVSSKYPRGGSNINPFDCNISENEFVQCVQNYSQETNYQNYMATYAKDFYQICIQKGVNPQLAFAHACLETGFGTKFIATNNYFGYAAYNSNPNEATSYATPSDSIEAYCDWVINNSTLESSAYQANVQRAEELSPYNSTLVGTPEINVYVLYIRYAQLDATHEGSYGDISTVKYLGTYYMTYYMYGEMCSHTSGTETTAQEKADYAVYSTNMRLDIIQKIFGNN